MTSKSELARLERQADEADMAAQIEDLVAATQNDVLTPEVKGEARSLGLGANAVRSTNDADMLVTLYHRYDGRVNSVPKYMAPRYTTERFGRGDQEVPEEHWGERVWLLRSDDTIADDYPRDFQCRLSTKAPAEVLAEMKAAGLNPSCRKRLKGGGFTSQFEADEHFRKKHPRRWAAYQRHLATATQANGTAAILAAVEAMKAMATSATS